MNLHDSAGINVGPIFYRRASGHGHAGGNDAAHAQLRVGSDGGVGAHHGSGTDLRRLGNHRCRMHQSRNHIAHLGEPREPKFSQLPISHRYDGAAVAFPEFCRILPGPDYPFLGRVIVQKIDAPENTQHLRNLLDLGAMGTGAQDNQARRPGRIVPNSHLVPFRLPFGRRLLQSLPVERPVHNPALLGATLYIPSLIKPVFSLSDIQSCPHFSFLIL